VTLPVLTPQLQLADLSFDYAIIARHISTSLRRVNKAAPSTVQLNSAITQVSLDDSITGSSTLEIRIADPDFTIQGFFDIDEDGELDAIDLNYPENTESWWRLTQFGIDDNTGSTTLTLTFMERPAVYLMHHFGPKKSKRTSKMTRAEFIRDRVKEVKKNGGLEFVSKELKVVQAIVGEKNLGPQTDADRKANKNRGIHEDSNLKIQGIKATVPQLRQANRALDVATDLRASDRAVEAMVCAAIGESGFRPIRNQGDPPSPYWGVFQGSMNTFAIDDTEGQARCFLKGGKGFHGNDGNGPADVGAMGTAEANKDWGPGLIAVVVEGSRSNFDSDAKAENHYGQYKDEANEIIAAYGGGFTGGTTYYRTSYYFQIGTEEEPHVDYWRGILDLADEVQWRLFVDGRTIYFDSDDTLIRQRPTAVIRRTNASTVAFRANWDQRKIATEMELELVCDPFAFRAGETLQLEGFGLLSRGSTAAGKVKLPGRWLITDITRSSNSLVSTLTLAQPVKPLREPANPIASRAARKPGAGGETVEKGEGLDGIMPGATAKLIIDNIVLPMARQHGMRSIDGLPLTAANVTTANARHGPTTAGTHSDHQGPPVDAWAADMQNATHPTPEMDDLADALEAAFDLPTRGTKNAVSGEHDENAVKATHKGWTFQLIYRSLLGGNHYNHVHFGVHRSGAPNPTGGVDHRLP
jgi:hypothetical protein